MVGFDRIWAGMTTSWDHRPTSAFYPGRLIKGLLHYWNGTSTKGRTPRSTRKRRSKMAQNSRRRNR